MVGSESVDGIPVIKEKYVVKNIITCCTTDCAAGADLGYCTHELTSEPPTTIAWPGKLLDYTPPTIP